MKSIETLAGEVEKIEAKPPPSAQELGTLLFEISSILTDIDDAIIVFTQMERLSRPRLHFADNLARLYALKERLRPVIRPHLDKTAHAREINGILEQLPAPEAIEAYISKLIGADSWETIARRAYIPQRFVGVVDATAVAVAIDEFSFLATHGIATCVGFALFSKTARRCALAHFDDVFNATGAAVTPTIIEQSQQYYTGCVRQILEYARLGSTTPLPTDWTIVLFPSNSVESSQLQTMLSNAARACDIHAGSIKISSATGPDRNVLINLKMFANQQQFTTKSYKETLQFDSFPPGLLSLREVLHLPPSGLRLYSMLGERLEEQNLDAGYSVAGRYVTPVELLPPGAPPAATIGRAGDEVAIAAGTSGAAPGRKPTGI